MALSADGAKISTLKYDLDASPGSKQIPIQQWNFPADKVSATPSGYRAFVIPFDESFRWYWYFSKEGMLATAHEKGAITFRDVTDEGRELYSLDCCPWTESMVLGFSSRATPRAVVGDT